MTNINADVLAINSVRGDEYFTLEKDVRIIADNLIPDLNIWCPFDTDESHFPHVLREYGHTVTAAEQRLLHNGAAARLQCCRQQPAVQPQERSPPESEGFEFAVCVDPAFPVSE